MKLLIALTAALAVTACARGSAVRTSGNTVSIDARSAPICGVDGSGRVATQMAAVETIRAGYDRYIIGGAGYQNNVSMISTPGTFRTQGTVGGGFYTARTTYTPGMPIVVGGHDRSLSVMMFRRGEPGYDNAIDARSALGPDWAQKVRNGVNTCL